MAGGTINIPTKIEFSRRRAQFEGTEINYVNPAIISQYKLQPVLLQHYQLKAAIEQKINALIHRSETQARDVIDLKILLDQLSEDENFEVSKKDKEKASETLASVSFDHFKSQVWPFLLSEYQAPYKERAFWDHVQDEVLNFIQTHLVIK